MKKKAELYRAQELLKHVDLHGFISLGAGALLQTMEDLKSDLFDWEMTDWLSDDYYITTDSGDDPIPVNSPEDLCDVLEDSQVLKDWPELQWKVTEYYGGNGMIFGYYDTRDLAIAAAEEEFKSLCQSDKKISRYEVIDLQSSDISPNHGILVENVTDVIDRRWMKHHQAYDWDSDGIAVLDTLSDEGERCLYDLDACLNIFARCDGDALPFDHVERVFDDLWHQRKRWTFDQIQQAMYAGFGQ